MKPYQHYKSSGIDWIGKIPEHWKTVKLKFLGTARNGLTYDNRDITDETTGILVLRSSNIQNSKLSFNDNVYCKNVPKELFIEKGDIIICSRNGSIDLVGKSAYIDKNIHATFGAFMLRYRSKIDPKYSFYLISYIISKYKGLYATTTVNQLTLSTLDNMLGLVPPLSEQEAIAEYLDRKCGEIDRMTGKYERQIALLKELKQSVISKAVTQGLNPQAPLRPSGIDWIGKIPEHWKVVRLKYICIPVGRIGFRGYNGADIVSEGEGAITLSPSNIKDGRMNYDKCSFLSWEKYYESPEIIVHNGDILFVKTASVGKIAYVDNLPMEATINPQLTILKNIKSFSRFVYYSMLTEVFQNQVINSVGGSTIPTISQERISNFMLINPPLSEQEAITEYLDRKCGEIDGMIGRIERKIELLRELRKTLISEAVTGKIDVREEVAR